MNPDLQKESQLIGNESANEGVASFSLSPGQARMWQVYCNDPRDTIYNGSFRMNLAGPVDPTILELSFSEIIRRHSVLRSKFEIAHGKPRCVIAPSLKFRVELTDLRTVPGELRETQMDAICRTEAELPFDLARGPLIRAALLQMEDQRYILMLTIHQIICDGWSIGLIMEELQKSYAAFGEGNPSPLPPLSVQYEDYIASLQKKATSEDSHRQLKYWTRQLRGYHRLEISPDLPGANRTCSQAEIISHLLPRELTDKLRDFSNEQGGTFFITSLAACLLLLHRYTGEKDVSVGAPLAGRNRTELETLIGQFVNHVVFRAEAEDNCLFPEFLARVKDSTWEAMANQDIPFEDAFKALGSATVPPPDPFFVINFICQREYGRASTFNFDFSGIRMSTMPSKSQGALYDLNFFLVEREIGWRLSLEYKTSLYRPETARQLLDHFKELLEGIATNPTRRLSEFPLSGNIPRPPAKTDSPESGEVYAMPASLVQQRFWLISQIEQTHPVFHMTATLRISGPLQVQALEASFQAIIDRHETLRTTFEEIDRELVQIISPAKPFVLPAIDLQAIPESKRENRLEVLIHRESTKPFDLTNGPLFRASLFILGPTEFILLTSIHHILADGWSNRVLQEDLWSAYTRLASGNLPSLSPLPIQYSDFSAWQREWLDSSEAKEHLEFWTKQLEGELPVINFPTDRPPTLRPASHGAMETQLLSEELAESLKTLAQSHNTTLFTVLLAGFGSLLSRYSNQHDIIIGSPVANRREETERLIGPFAGPVGLRLDFSGSPSLRALLQRVQEVNLNALNHAELPFETVMDRLRMRTVNGRKPIFQFYFFYQNAFVQPRQEGLLAITPLPTISLGIPFELQLGMIERKEGIRAQLEYNPDLYDPRTIRQVLSDYEKILVAFVAQPDLSLDSLSISPVTQAPRGTMAVSSRASIVAPQTGTERALAKIWEDVLSVRSIGRNQDYFELGGNSLLAVRLFTEIDRHFHVHLPISTLFYAKTIEEFADLIDRQQTGDSWSPLVPIQPAGSRTPFFCVHGGGGNVLIYRNLSRHLGPDQPFYGLQSQGLDGKRPPLETIEEMAALYVEEIKKVQPHGPYYLGGYCLGGTVALELAQLLTARGEEVATVAFFDTVNWARLRPRGLIGGLRRQLERLHFHAKNFLLLDFQGKRGFLSEKWKVLRSRTTVWRGFLLSRLHGNRVVNFSESRLLARIWETNDRASVNYVPRPYLGRIADFRPMCQYSTYLEPNVNWDGIALGGLDVYQLPVYPAGMLLEPFVKELAKALQSAMDRASAATP